MSFANTVMTFQCGKELVTGKRVIGTGYPVPLVSRDGCDIPDNVRLHGRGVWSVSLAMRKVVQVDLGIECRHAAGAG